MGLDIDPTIFNELQKNEAMLQGQLTAKNELLE
jgi:hypothetical protein